MAGAVTIGAPVSLRSDFTVASPTSARKGESRLSHFTHLETKITDKDFLKLALRDLDLRCREGDLEMKSHAGERVRVEIQMNVAGHPVGFRKSGDAFDLVGDAFALAALNRAGFMRRLTQRYAYHAAKARLEEQGFDLVAEEVGEDGEIHLLLRRMTTGLGGRLF